MRRTTVRAISAAMGLVGTTASAVAMVQAARYQRLYAALRLDLRAAGGYYAGTVATALHAGATRTVLTAWMADQPSFEVGTLNVTAGPNETDPANLTIRIVGPSRAIRAIYFLLLRDEKLDVQGIAGPTADDSELSFQMVVLQPHSQEVVALRRQLSED